MYFFYKYPFFSFFLSKNKNKYFVKTLEAVVRALPKRILCTCSTLTLVDLSGGGGGDKNGSWERRAKYGSEWDDGLWEGGHTTCSVRERERREGERGK